MKLATIHGMDAFVCVSAMQKAVRRGDERMAMEFACEIAHTSKPLFTMVCNRLEVISHEDIGLAATEVVVFVATAIEQAKRHYDGEKPGKWRMMIGNAIRAMARAMKSREGDHFQAAVGVPNKEFGATPTVPDWANDGHTLAGRKLGRGLDFFRSESAKLDRPAGQDKYEDEAYDAWKRKAGLLPPESPE